jgi:hypothetical protein
MSDRISFPEGKQLFLYRKSYAAYLRIYKLFPNKFRFFSENASVEQDVGICDGSDISDA